MRIVLNPTGISPHQLPLARAIVQQVGSKNFRYICHGELEEGRVQMGWNNAVSEPWMVRAGEQIGIRNDWLENADLLVSSIRNVNLFERRLTKGLKTFYTSERWFKPPLGAFRLMMPHYRAITKTVSRQLTQYPHFKYLAIGPWAADDMKRLGVPDTKIVPWGYFVAPGCRTERPLHNPLKVLCVGRLLKLKHFETVVRAVSAVNRKAGAIKTMLSILGDGPEEVRLKELASKLSLKNGQPSTFTFHKSMPIEQVRPFMREHDVLVFSSNGYDGWGAVVSEALEEGLRVIGTFEAGASSAMLPKECLYHCGDWKTLARLLDGDIPYVGIREWTAEKAAERLLAL